MASKTLAEILQDSKGISTGEILKSLAEALEKQDSERAEQSASSFFPVLNKINDNHALLIDLIKKLGDKVDVLTAKPDPVFPEPREFPAEIAITKPDWYKEPAEQDMSWVPNMTNSIRYDGDKTRALLQKVLDKLNEEPEVEEPKEEPKTVNSAAVRSRRTTQWKRFDNYNLNNILNPSGDNQTYFLPDSLIPNSERVSLNGGAPLLNSDYTLIGNQLFFTVANIPGAQIDVRGQTR